MADDLLLALPGSVRKSHDGGEVMIGGQCSACGLKVFPKPTICHACWCEVINEVELARTGTLYSYAIVHAARKGWQSPYVIAYIDLDDGVRVCGQMDHSPNQELPLGSRVSLKVGRLRESSDGTIYHAHRFALMEAV
jgi:uncharacterized OB-fold protein